MSQLYYIGGCVRDKLLGINPKDIDIVYAGGSFEMMRQVILNMGGTIFIEKPEYLTIRCKIPVTGPVDFVLARKDGKYSDGRRPDSVDKASLLEDQNRRDFTVNSMAQDIETGEIIDPFGGQVDLSNGLLRCVGNARERFTEDGLRLLRAVRFSVTKGLVINNDIETLLLDYTFFEPLLNKVCQERIQQELLKCFVFDTSIVLEILAKYASLSRWIFRRTNIWLKPTLESK